MSNTGEARKVFNESLVWKLNENLHKIFPELFQRLGLSSPEAATAHAELPGREVVALLNLLMNKEGNLHRFYMLLQQLKQTASLELIDNSPAVILFQKSVVNPEQPASEKIEKKNDGEIAGTMLLSDMKPTDLEVIINQCASTEGWKKLALCFGSLKVNHKQLEVGYKKSDNGELCEALFLILVDRGITIEELVRAFEDKRVGLNLLADLVRNIACESNVSQQGESSSTTGLMNDANKAAVYLFELHSLDLDGLAKKCHAKSKEMWKIASEYFGNNSHFKKLELTNAQSRDENDRTEVLFKFLAQQGFTLKELALFLKHDEIELENVANKILTAKYRKRNVPVALQTDQQLTNQPYSVPTDRIMSNQKVQARVPYHFSWPAQGQRLIDPSEQLEILHNKLTNNTVVAIVGLSGFGKSTLAREYGYRDVSNYQFAVWIDCKNDTTLVASYYRLSKWLGVDTSNQTHSDISLNDFITKEHVRIAQVKDNLQGHKCLVVFDDCNSWETLKTIFNHLMPTNAYGNVIITSQIVEWNVQINAKVELFNMQEVQYDEEKIVKYLRSVARDYDTSEEDARAIYHMYKGFTMAYYLVACYVSDGRTLRYFREKAEEQKINVTNDVPLFMLISSFDGELLLLMRILAILYSADVQCLADLLTKDLWRKHEKTDNFVDKFQASIRKSLISLTRVNDMTLVNIGHDIVRDYLLQKMSLPAFEVVVDKCIQENFHYWQLRHIVREYHAKNLEHGSDLTTVNKLVEIAILWEQPYVNRLVKEFQISRSNYPHHLRLIELAEYSHPSSEDNDIVDFFKNNGNTWLASLASYQLKKLSGDWSQPEQMNALDIKESDEDNQEVKEYNKNLREKHDQLRLMIQLEQGKWLVRQGQVKEGIEQLKACYEYRKDKFGLFRRNTNVAHIKLMQAQLASDATSVKLEALKLFKQLIATANMTLDLSCRDAAQLLADACKKLSVSPQLLYRPDDRKSSISDEEVLKMMQEERRKTIQKRCTLDDPSLSLIQLDHNMFQFGLGTHVIFMCKLAIFPQAQLPVAFLEAIEPSFPLITLRLEALYLIAEALESAIGWEKIKEKCLALNIQITSNMDRLPRLKFTPERKSSEKLGHIFMQILELACRHRYSVRSFIDWLKSLEVSDELMERLQQQLYDTHLAPADFVVESTRLKYDFARDTR